MKTYSERSLKMDTFTLITPYLSGISSDHFFVRDIVADIVIQTLRGEKYNTITIKQCVQYNTHTHEESTMYYSQAFSLSLSLNHQSNPE